MARNGYRRPKAPPAPITWLVQRIRLCGTFGPWVLGVAADAAPDVIAEFLG